MFVIQMLDTRESKKIQEVAVGQVRVIVWNISTSKMTLLSKVRPADMWMTLYGKVTLSPEE
jgi:hypothetical protein